MQEALLATIKIIGWLGIILALLTIVNTVCGIIVNTDKVEGSFSWSILFKGLLKALVFYGCSALLAVSFTLLPFVNDMITNIYGVQFIAEDTLTTLSTTAVFAVVIGVIVVQGKKALEGIVELTKVKAVKGEIVSWEVEDADEETDNGEEKEN